MGWYIQSAGRKTLNQEFYIQQNHPSEMKGKLRHAHISKNWETPSLACPPHKKYEKKLLRLKWNDTTQARILVKKPAAEVKVTISLFIAYKCIFCL